MTGAEALRNSVDLAQLCDRLGYRRYWVAEHHATPMLACASPEALIGPIATVTSRIKVGSGGVMLPHYSPLKVAETFSMFAGLFPDRIDLGARPRAGQRSENRLCVAARPATAGARRFSRAAGGADRLSRRPAAAGSSFSRAREAARPAARAGSPISSAPRRRAASGPVSSACPTSSPTSSIRRAPRSPQRYRDEFTPSESAPEAAHHRRSLGARGGNRRGSGAALRQPPHGDAALSAEAR